MKISVVGAGRVGGATALAMVARGLPHELVLVGRDRDRCVGDALDLQHAAAFVRPMRVWSGDVADTAGSDIVVVSASVAVDAAGDRLAGASANARLLRQLVPALAAASPGAVFVVLSNPVDICTYITLKASGLPPSQVLGTGTLVDTARFRALISRDIGIDATDIRAYVLGEHGASQFPALSVASAGGVKLGVGHDWIQSHFEEARLGGDTVMRHKGYTNHAVALSATLICEAIAADARTIFPVSTLVEGFNGVEDVCLSLPCVVGRGGVRRVLSIDLDEREVGWLRRSAAVLRGVLDGLG